MYRDAVVAIVVGLAATVLTADSSLAFGHGGGTGGHSGPVMTSATPAVFRGPARPGPGPVPMTRKLSGRGVVKCIRACMHGVDAGWAGFCEYSCAGP
jgi:hypothetical protein